MSKKKNITNGHLKIHVTTLGCSKNVYDSEILMGQVEAGKAVLVEKPEEADVMIINTCGFITPAKQESIDAILEAERIKQKDPQKKIVVCGCLSSRYGSELRKELPAVDAFFGTEDYAGILKFLGMDEDLSPEFLYERRHQTTPRHYAYLKIAEGCNHKCAFCAIPLMRGRHRSKPISILVKEAERLAENGVKEIIIVSQDSTFYGIDLYGKPKIVDLLKELEKIEGIEWIRLHYLYPTSVPPDLIETMSRSTKIVPYLDMPVQHISDRMLGIMKRGGNAFRIRQIFKEARRKIKDVALRTTLIVGHPGETDADFELLLNFVQEMRFDRLGVFPYSHEEHTAAFELPDLPEEVKEERYRKLMEVQQQISLENNEAKVGKVFRVILDEVNHQEQYAIGRTTADSPDIDNEVIIQSFRPKFKPGDFINVKIIDATEYELYGELEN